MSIELPPSSTGEDSSSTSARRLQSEKAQRRRAATATGSNSSSPLVVRAKHASDIVYRQPSDCSSRGWKYEKVLVKELKMSRQRFCSPSMTNTYYRETK